MALGRHCKMSEAQAWSTLRKWLKGLPGEVHIQRLEEKLAHGVPDTNVCWMPKGEFETIVPIEFWLEGKHLKAYPKRDSTKVKIGLSPAQALWLMERQRAEGFVYVWCRLPDGWIFFTDHFDLLRDGVEYGTFKTLKVYDTCAEMLNAIVYHMKQRIAF